MNLQLKPPAPKLEIKVIRSNPASRYCTKRRTIRRFPYYCDTAAQYVATFCQLNNLIP